MRSIILFHIENKIITDNFAKKTMNGTTKLMTSINQVIRGDVSCIDDNFIIIDRLDKINI